VVFGVDRGRKTEKSSYLCPSTRNTIIDGWTPEPAKAGSTTTIGFVRDDGALQAEHGSHFYLKAELQHVDEVVVRIL